MRNHYPGAMVSPLKLAQRITKGVQEPPNILIVAGRLRDKRDSLVARCKQKIVNRLTQVVFIVCYTPNITCVRHVR